MGEIRQVESDGCSYLDAISSYHLNRGKVVTKIAKYPHVEDFRQTVLELDEKQVTFKALWSITAKNTQCSTGPLTRPFARLLGPLTRWLAPHYSL